MLAHWHVPRTSLLLQEGVRASLYESNDTQQPHDLEVALLLGHPHVVEFLRRSVMVTPEFLYLQSQLKLAEHEHCSTDWSAGQTGVSTVSWGVEAQHWHWLTSTPFCLTTMQLQFLASSMGK
jgi:hypothetical protein